MKPVFRILMIVVAVVLGAFWYVHWSRTRAMNSGEVFVREQSSNRTTRPNQEMAENEADGAGPSAFQSQDGVATLPASDTISRNPPNGIVVAHPGRYQLYRQGDITWRLDTNSGDACVLFATETQWRKTLVYDHGCGGH
jgi:hypothetical protein